MKLGDICPAPCLLGASEFAIPEAGCGSSALKFGSAQGRDYFAVLLRNHDLASAPNISPRVAIVGLSPASNQIDEFVDAYRRTGDYAEAAIRGAFAGLSRDVILMMRGLGLAEKLELRLKPDDGFSRHPDIYVTSLVACATLTTSGSSTDFDPGDFQGARNCVEHRFLPEILNPAFTRLTHVIILGAKGWKAAERLRMASGRSVIEELKRAGKVVLNLPHPSGANREYVNLAVLPLGRMPAEKDYVEEKWEDYRLKCRSEGKVPEREEVYKKKRRTVWNSIYELRWDIAKLEGAKR